MANIKAALETLAQFPADKVLFTDTQQGSAFDELGQALADRMQELADSDSEDSFDSIIATLVKEGHEDIAQDLYDAVYGQEK